MAILQERNNSSRNTPFKILTGKTFLLIFLLLIGIIYQTSAKAKSQVTGKYSSSSGKHIVLNLQTFNPAPTNLIVEQFLSPENNIISSSPRAKKSSRGKIKWLIKNNTTGRLSISIQLQSPLQGSISAIVRYRDPGSGNFTELHISP